MSSGYEHPKEQQRQGAELALERLAMVVAAMLALPVAPYLNAVTAPYIVALVWDTYGPDLTELIRVLWLIGCFLLIFFGGHVLFSLGLKMAWSYVAQRLL